MKSSVFLNVPLSSFPGSSGARVARGSVPASVFTFAFPGGPACAFPVPAVTDGRGPGQMTTDRGHKRQNLSRFRQPEVQNRGVGRAVLRLGAPGRCRSSPPSAPWRPQAPLACGRVAPASASCPGAGSSSVCLRCTNVPGFQLETGEPIRRTLRPKGKRPLLHKYMIRLKSF